MSHPYFGPAVDGGPLPTEMTMSTLPHQTEGPPLTRGTSTPRRFRASAGSASTGPLGPHLDELPGALCDELYLCWKERNRAIVHYSKLNIAYPPHVASEREKRLAIQIAMCFGGGVENYDRAARLITRGRNA